MMNRKTVLIILPVIFTVIPLLTSCRKITVDSTEKEAFLECSGMGFYPEGCPLFVYSEQLHQTCVNHVRSQFRIQTGRQDTCMNIILEDEPKKEGDLVMSSLDYIDRSIRVTDRIQFECSRISGGRVWLWDGYTKTGVIIPSGL